MEDSRLLRLLHKDPSTGMEQLMRQYTGLVYSVVKGRLVNSNYISSDLEDCVADVFSKFYTDLPSYDPAIASIKTYLCVIARGYASNVVKRRSHLASIAMDDDEVVLQLADEETAEEALAEEALIREVIGAVEALGEPDSSILFRKYYYGESSKEIAEAVGLTVANVDTRAHRALNKLRKQFGGNKT